MDTSTGNNTLESGKTLSLYEQACQALRDRILTGNLPPGTVLGEEALSRELGMSRTPIREALAELVSHGLLEKLPWRGVIVCKIELQSLLDITEMQCCLLEWGAMCIESATAADIEFLEASLGRQCACLGEERMAELLYEAREMDRRIVGFTGNQEMVRTMDNLSDRLIYAGWYVANHMASMNEAVDEHAALVEAIRWGDAERAVQAVRQHFYAARLRLVGGSQSGPLS